MPNLSPRRNEKKRIHKRIIHKSSSNTQINPGAAANEMPQHNNNRISVSSRLTEILLRSSESLLKTKLLVH
jgi:hypothetical protein